MLARDRFEHQTPNVIDPGEYAPTPNHRSTSIRKSGQSEELDHRDSSLSYFGNGNVQSSLYTRNGNKGAISKGIPIVRPMYVGEYKSEIGDYSDDDCEKGQSKEEDAEDPESASEEDSESTCDYDVGTDYEGSIEFGIRKEDNHDSFQEKLEVQQKRNNRFVLGDEDDEDEEGLERRLFAKAISNEVEKGNNSQRNLMAEVPSMFHQMMARVPSIRKESSTFNRSAAMARARASSFRNSNSSRNSADGYMDNIYLKDDPSTFGDEPIPEDSDEEEDEDADDWIKSVCQITMACVIGLFLFGGSKFRHYFLNPPADAAAKAISSDSRLNEIVGFLSDATISSVEDLNDVSSPQFKAAWWLAEEDSEMLVIPTNQTARVGNTFDFVQRYSLLVFYYAMAGDGRFRRGWTNSRNFASQGQHECSWYESVLLPGGSGIDDITNDDEDDPAFVNPNSFGSATIASEREYAMGVTCNRELRVTRINLPDNNLKGSIPSEIQYLSQLDYFDLSHNSLVGSIPDELRNLKHLTHLDLSSNQLSGQISSHYWLGKRFPLLEFLNLSKNSLELLPLLNQTGNSQNIGHDTPSSYEGESHLRTLVLGCNNHNDDDANNPIRFIPEEFRYLSNLHELSLDNLNLGGGIPGWVFHELEKLQFLDLSHNQLTGKIAEISTEFSHPEHLKSLLLHDNELTGTLPGAIGLLPDLSTITLHHTNMQVGYNAVNFLCYRMQDPSGLEMLTTDCGDTTCPCCLEQCCTGEGCFGDVDWNSGTSFSSLLHSSSHQNGFW